MSQSNDRSLYGMMLVLTAALAAAGLASPGPVAALRGFAALQLAPARLIHDFTVTGGAGGALLNAALMGALTLILVLANGVRLSGPTIAGAFTVMGFSLFGKTPLNVLPVVAGVFIASRIAGKPFKSYILIAIFGSALGPLAMSLALEAGLPPLAGAAAGALGGLIAGAALPGLAVAMLRLHEGYNLYNIGFTCGFLGLFAAAFLAAAGRELPITVIWGREGSWALSLAVPFASLLCAGWGAALGRKRAFADYPLILKSSGRLPTDFMDLASPGAALLNMGVLGLLGSAYVFACGADFNGPVLGGLFTLMGFGAFGKHPFNSLPVMGGVFAATLAFGKSLSAPGPLLAILFCTTLAPLSGEFGPAVGFIAGFAHLAIVERSASWHMGIDLYNNGFAGGLTATLVAALMEWIRSNKRGK